MAVASDGVSECTFHMLLNDTYRLDGCDRTSCVSSTDRPIRLDLWLVTRHSGGPVHSRAQASVHRLGSQHGSFHALFELLEPEEALLKQQKLVLVGGDRVVEVIELSRHHFVVRVVLPQAAELFNVLVEFLVDLLVLALDVAATLLVEDVSVLVLALLLLLLAIVRTFLSGVAVHWSVFN